MLTVLCFFLSGGNLIEFCLVIMDVFVRIITSLLQSHVPPVGVLRVLRLFRILRAARLLSQFRELNAIVLSMWSSMKTIFWSIMVLAIFLTIAALVAVEIVNPLNQKLAAQGAYANCERCPRAFSSVWNSNLTFFQGIVAGDSWGLVIIPIIEYYPPIAIFFIVLTVIIVLGVMNLVLTTIVEQANEAKFYHKIARCKRAKYNLMQLSREMDLDENGFLTLSDLHSHVKSQRSFEEALQELDVKADDLMLLFKLMDTNGSGRISYTQFVDNLYKIKTRDVETMLVFIQHYTGECHSKLAQIIDSELTILKEQYALLKSLASKLEQDPSPTRHDGHSVPDFLRDNRACLQAPSPTDQMFVPVPQERSRAPRSVVGGPMSSWPQTTHANSNSIASPVHQQVLPVLRNSASSHDTSDLLQKLTDQIKQELSDQLRSQEFLTLLCRGSSSGGFPPQGNRSCQQVPMHGAVDSY